MMYWTQDAVRAEMDYRLEKAQVANVGRVITKDRPSWLRRLRLRGTPRAVFRATHAHS